MLSHHWPGYPEGRIVLCLVLVDLENMVGSMCRDQASNNVFLQIGIEMAKEIGYLVGIGLLEVSPSKIR
jgi:hypothetical protein